MVAKIGANCMAVILLLAVLTVLAGIIMPVVYLFEHKTLPGWGWVLVGIMAAAWVGKQVFGRGEAVEGGKPLWKERDVKQPPMVVGPWVGHTIVVQRKLGGSSEFWRARPVVIDMTQDDGNWQGDAAVARRYIGEQYDGLMDEIGVEVHDVERA